MSAFAGFGMDNSSSGEPEKEDNHAILSYKQRNYLVISLLVGLIVLLVLTLLYLVLPPFLKWLRRPKPQDEDQRTERRYETIEGWLISKRVRAHTEDCAKLQMKLCQPCKEQPEDVSSPKSVKMSPSYDSTDTAQTGSSSGDEEMGEEEKECAICMEPFVVDDIVSWSPNIDASCRHVFHHECIKEWMLQSGNCPCCRELILPIDAEGFVLERPLLKELCKKRALLAATTYYCNVEGFVCFDKPGKCTRATIELLKQATACRITPKDLTDRRGHRTNAADEKELSDSNEEEPQCNSLTPTNTQEANEETPSELTVALVEGAQLSGPIQFMCNTSAEDDAPFDEANNVVDVDLGAE